MQTQSVKLNFPALKASLEIRQLDEKTIVYRNKSDILFKEDRYDLVIFATLNSLFVNRAPIDIKALFSKGSSDKRIPVGDFYKWYLGLCFRFRLGGQEGIKEEQVKRIKLRLGNHLYIRIHFPDLSDCSIVSNVNYIWIKSTGNLLIYDKHTYQMTLNGEHIDNLKIIHTSVDFLFTTWYVKWPKFLQFLNCNAKAKKPNIQPLCPIRCGSLIQIEATFPYKFVQQLHQSYSFIDSTHGHPLVQLGDNLYCNGRAFMSRSNTFYTQLRTIRLDVMDPYFRFFDINHRYFYCSFEKWPESSSSEIEDASELDDSEQELAFVFSNNFRSPQMTVPLQSQMDQPMHRKEELEEEAKNLCSICLDRELAFAAMPCAHLCCCDQCFVPLTQCPICKAKVNKFMRIFIA